MHTDWLATLESVYVCVLCKDYGFVTVLGLHISICSSIFPVLIAYWLFPYNGSVTYLLLIFLRECQKFPHFLSVRENEEEFPEIILIKIYVLCT